MNATHSAQLAKRVAVPDITCSARPRGTSGAPGSTTATCTTKARWAGNRDWDDGYVGTCLSPCRRLCCPSMATWGRDYQGKLTEVLTQFAYFSNISRRREVQENQALFAFLTHAAGAAMPE